MGQKNFILAVLISVGFVVIWSQFVVPRLAPPPAPVTATPSASSPAGSVAASPESVSASPSAPRTHEAPTLHLQNAANDITFDARGGAVESWQLKSAKEGSVELVVSPDNGPLPLATFGETVFRMKAQGTRVDMSATLTNGLLVTKTLELSDKNHLHKLTFRFTNPTPHAIELSPWEIGWGPGLGTVPSEMKENASLTRALAMSRLTAHVIKEGDHPEFGRWVGLDNRYYLVAFIPKLAHSAQVLSTGKKETTRLRILETTSIPPRGESVIEYQLYVGPKGYTALKQYGESLEASVDFGIFGWLGKVILNAVYWLKEKTGNFGVAIIVLTIGLQLLLLPLTLKSFKAAQAMKNLQPKMARLQEMYKGDPKRLNVEMLNLYKTSGTNPFGGCLPMLMQLPIFWALFTTLRNAYELRGAPFVGWIHDLSMHDPYYILPVVMGGGMFLQQRMTGMASDPTQRQMMYIMPIVFTFMFMNFPAGLVLYWLTNSIMTITIQWIYLKRTTGTPSRPQVVNP